MNKTKILGIAGGIAALIGALTLRGCISDSTPIDPGDNNGQAGGSIQKIDSALVRLRPQLWISQTGVNSYQLGMTVGAGGASDSPAMTTLRTIQAVQFDIYGPDRRLIATQKSESILSSGVKNPETGEESITTFTSVRYTPSTPPANGAYAIMTVIGTNGVATQRASFPEIPFVH